LSAGAVSFIVERLLREGKEKHAAVLVYLLYAGQALEAELRRAMAGGRYLADARTASKVIEELVLMNLLERSSVGGRYKLYRLTELGRAVAEELKRSQKLEELAAPAGLGARAGGALSWAQQLATLSVLIEATAAAQGVDTQPLTHKLLMEAANLLREAGLGGETARLEEVARRFREPSAGEAAAVEETLAWIRAALARSGLKLKPLDLEVAIEIVKLFKNHSASAR
jgi:DNA-binding MarR family transcriptional regulator